MFGVQVNLQTKKFALKLHVRWNTIQDCVFLILITLVLLIRNAKTGLDDNHSIPFEVLLIIWSRKLFNGFCCHRVDEDLAWRLVWILFLCDAGTILVTDHMFVTNYPDSFDFKFEILCFLCLRCGWINILRTKDCRKHFALLASLHYVLATVSRLDYVAEYNYVLLTNSDV